MKQNQKNNLKRLILVLALSTLVFTGVEVSAEITQTQALSPVSATAAAKQNEVQAPSVLPTNFQKPSENVTTIPAENAKVIQDIEKKGFKSTLVKFLLAMLGVVVSAGAIFLGLKFYKNVVLKGGTTNEVISIENSLHSPKDFKEAINLFLNKTDK